MPCPGKNCLFLGLAIPRLKAGVVWGMSWVSPSKWLGFGSVLVWFWLGLAESWAWGSLVWFDLVLVQSEYHSVTLR